MKKTILTALLSAVSLYGDGIEFPSVPVPERYNDQTVLRSIDHVLSDGRKTPVKFSRIMTTGERDNGEIFGASKDYKDRPIHLYDGSPYICNGTNDAVGAGVDFSSLHRVGEKLYLISQFECRLGSMYMVELDQGSDGTLTPKKGTLRYISQKSEFGGYNHCAGVKTPWNSHLGSEEYEFDARAVEQNITSITCNDGGEDYNEIVRYFHGKKKLMNPYYYGWTPEVKIDDNGTPHYTKHYTMGRFSHELSFVMPDQRTVYMSDDGFNTGLYKFVADKAGDLGSGRLSMAKLTQKSSQNGGSFYIRWIDLGHADDREVRAYLDPDHNISTNDGLRFSDLFDTADPKEGRCPRGFASIHTIFGHECLRVKEGMETAASRLETRRYGAMQGATTEFRKMEGITYDPNRNRLYISISEVSRGMEDYRNTDEADDRYDLGGPNDIRLPYNMCGGVYELPLDEHYNADSMTALLNGTYRYYDANSTYAGNQCDVDGIANPDNLTFIPGSDTLLIAEDSKQHLNNAVWAYDMKSKKLSRLLTAPLEAENTSLYWYGGIGDYDYILTVVQHPLRHENVPPRDKESAVRAAAIPVRR